MITREARNKMIDALNKARMEATNVEAFLDANLKPKGTRDMVLSIRIWQGLEETKNTIDKTIKVLAEIIPTDNLKKKRWEKGG